MAKVIRFGKNEDAVLDLRQVGEELSAAAEAIELKQTLLESIEEEGRNMLAMAGLKDLVFTMDEECAEMFADAPPEIFAMDPDNPAVLVFTAWQDDIRYQISLGIHLYTEEERADMTFALSRQDEDGFSLYDLEKGWRPVPPEAVSGMCKSQMEILEKAGGEENELTEFVTFTRARFGVMDDETFLDCREAYAELIDIYDSVKDYCIYGVIHRGEDEHIPVLVPRDPVVQGICLAYEGGLYWLCQWLPDMLPVKVAGFEDREALEESLDSMLDHFYPDMVYILPLSGNAYVKADDLDADFEIFAGHPLTEEEQEAFDRLMDMAAEVMDNELEF